MPKRRRFADTKNTFQGLCKIFNIDKWKTKTLQMKQYLYMKPDSFKPRRAAAASHRGNSPALCL